MFDKKGLSTVAVSSIALAISTLVPLSIVALAPVTAFAQAAPTNAQMEEAVKAAAKAQAGADAKFKALKPTTGTIALRDAKADLVIPAGYGYLNAGQSKTLLTDVWGNPPEEAQGVLGIIVKMDGASIVDTWAAVITYDDSGYVTDTDAADIQPAKLLADEQSGEADLNAQRTEAGYDTVHLSGWAEPPYYDAAGKRIYWAKRLKFSSSDTESLNYSIRVLGRRGYLSMNFVAGVEELDAVKAAAPDVLKMANFKEGERYADFKEGDKASGLGLAGLVAGAAAVGVAKKVGLIGLLIAFGKKGFVLVLALFGWLFSKFKGMFGKKEEAEIVGDYDTSDPFAPPAPNSALEASTDTPLAADNLTSQNPPSNGV